MCKLVFIINVIIFYSLTINISVFANNINQCEWDNRNYVPCLEINTSLTNSSKFSKSGVNKVVISKQQILDIGATDLIDVFRSIPDLNITQSGPRGQQASVFMRGTGSNHTLVMINGIPINDQSTTQGLHDFGVDFIQTIQQIEIYPGSSSTQFGANAIGGAINIVLTGDFKDSFSLSFDKNNNYDLSANKTLVNDNYSINLKVGRVINETISAMGNKSDEKDSLENNSININYENYFDNFRIFNNTYLRQTITEYDESALNQIGYEGDNKMLTTQFGFENLDIDNKKKYILHYTNYNRKYNEKGIIDKYESEVFGLKYDLSKTIGNLFSFGAGLEYNYNWGYFDNQGSYEATTKGHTQNKAINSNLGWNLNDKSNLSFFFRMEEHKQTGFISSNKINYNQKFNNIVMGSSFMTGYRNPTLYELFGTDNFGYSGNKSLKPEKNETLEIYSNIYLENNTIFSIRAFKSKIKNNIEYLNNSYQNDEDDIDLNQSGINAKIEFKKNNSKINLFSSFLSSEKENGGAQLRRPENNYGFIYSNKLTNYLLGDVNLNIIYNHTGKYLDTHSSTFQTIEMDSTNILDIALHKIINGNEMYLKISNIFNETFQKPHGYNQENRVIKFGFRYRTF